MLALANKLLSGLEEQLSSLEQEYDVILKRSELSFLTCKKMIESLKAIILKHKFKNEEEEIKFFKEVKPLFTSRQVYHLMVYNIETRKPNGGKEILKKYYAKELEKLKHYFDYNIDFYKYHRAGATFLDRQYFIRNKFDIQLGLDGHVFENDPVFSTTHDFKVAKILAHDRLQIYIENELVLIENKDANYNTSQDTLKLKLTWTDSKTHLIELVYALHSYSVFSHGKADIKEIASTFEKAFDIDLGDYYRTYLEIRDRKSGSTKFLALLQKALAKRMEDQDEK